MGLKKCPICELNYIRDDQKCCDVCNRALKSVKHAQEQDELEILCAECGENPAVEGSELCEECLRESRRQEKLKRKEGLTGDVLDIGGLDEIEVPLMDDDEIPESEMEEIDMELGDPMSDEEEDDDQDTDDK